MKVNGYTFRGSHSVVFIFASHIIRVNFKERICFARSRLYFERAALSRKANRKSQKLFPFIKIPENHRGVLIHLKTLLSVTIHVDINLYEIRLF